MHPIFCLTTKSRIFLLKNRILRFSHLKKHFFWKNLRTKEYQVFNFKTNKNENFFLSFSIFRNCEEKYSKILYSIGSQYCQNIEKQNEWSCILCSWPIFSRSAHWQKCTVKVNSSGCWGGFKNAKNIRKKIVLQHC